MDAKERIKNYLEDKAKNDTSFAATFAKPNKNIDECYRYIITEMRKLGNEVGVDDEDVFNLAVHYYDEDNITAPTAPPAIVKTTETKASTTTKDNPTSTKKNIVSQLSLFDELWSQEQD